MNLFDLCTSPHVNVNVGSVFFSFHACCKLLEQFILAAPFECIFVKCMFVCHLVCKTELSTVDSLINIYPRGSHMLRIIIIVGEMLAVLPELFLG